MQKKIWKKSCAGRLAYCLRASYPFIKFRQVSFLARKEKVELGSSACFPRNTLSVNSRLLFPFPFASQSRRCFHLSSLLEENLYPYVAEQKVETGEAHLLMPSLGFVDD